MTRNEFLRLAHFTFAKLEYLERVKRAAEFAAIKRHSAGDHSGGHIIGGTFNRPSLAEPIRQAFDEMTDDIARGDLLSLRNLLIDRIECEKEGRQPGSTSLFLDELSRFPLDFSRVDSSKAEGNQDSTATEAVPWKKAAERLSQWKVEGKPRPAVRYAAKEIGCSGSTIQKAFARTDSLKDWGEKPKEVRITKPLGSEVTDGVYQELPIVPDDEVTKTLDRYGKQIKDSDDKRKFIDLVASQTFEERKELARTIVAAEN